MSSDTDAPQFVIRSSPRTGSHMLATALDSHSQLHVTGEAFLRPEVYDIEPGDTIAGCLDRILARYHGFIQHRWIPLRHPGKPRKKHATCNHLWSEIAARPELKIVSLKRRNLLAMAVSITVAQQSRVWQVQKEEAATQVIDKHRDAWCAARYDARHQPPVRLDPEWLGKSFQQTTDEYARWEPGLPGERLLEVFYEDLATSPSLELDRVQRFLGVQPETISPATKKQEHRPLSEAIENYPSLRRYFQGTRWAKLFD